MTLTERLEAKRAEYAQADTEQQKLWNAVQVQEAMFKRYYLTPWSDAYTKSSALAKEIEVLEAMSKEMGGV